jgi:antirestriction protein ArdC
MRSYIESTNPRWAELLRRAVTEPGIISQAFTRFHNYSMGNQLLAWCQCERRGIEPGPIATYPKWKQLGRHVKKNERALVLCQPVTIKRTKTTDEHSASTERAESAECLTRFVYRPHWFVLSQTDGAEYVPEPLPAWDAETALSTLNIERVPFTAMDGNIQGFAKNRTVAINPVAEQPESTLFHELGHIVLGHTAEGTLNSDSTDRTPRDIRELEAECVALLCCESLGLPGAELSRGYIQSWLKGNEVPERSAQRIFHAADQILKAGRTVQNSEAAI